MIIQSNINAFIGTADFCKLALCAILATLISTYAFLAVLPRDIYALFQKSHRFELLSPTDSVFCPYSKSTFN